ncbi:MAG: hypothetical protein L0241_27280 [Planctomycetia bacterium]|nr:hypothetical protein [Planctomycetia bacterium]
MMRFASSRWLATAVIATGLVATAFAGQPPLPAPQPQPNLLEIAKAKQKAADQKLATEVDQILRDADRLAKNGNTPKAIQQLKTARGNLALAVGISETARTQQTLRLDQKIAILQGRPLPNGNLNPGVQFDPKGADVKAAKKLSYDNYLAELKAVREGIDLVNKYQAAGLMDKANAEIANLNRLYPNNPSVMVLTQTDTLKNRIADAQAFNKIMDDRMWKLQKQTMESNLPAVRDMEFPKGWKELSERRKLSGMMQLTAKEKKIIEALDKPISVNFANRPLEEALQDLSNAFDQPLLIDKKSLDDLGLDLKKGVTLQTPQALSGRTVLRSILATQGLTFVVKDETIQIVTVERARNMLTTRTYYLGDLIQAGPFSDPRFGPVVNAMQAAENAKVLVDMIVKSVDPLMWKENGGPGSVTFHFPSKSIIVRASAEVHYSLSNGFRGR